MMEPYVSQFGVSSECSDELVQTNNADAIAHYVLKTEISCKGPIMFS